MPYGIEIEAIEKGEAYGAKCLSFGSILRTAPKDGIVVKTPDGGVFFSLAAVMVEVDKVRAKRGGK